MPSPNEPWHLIPEDWIGTAPEYALYYAHKRLGLEENVDFMYTKGREVMAFKELDLLLNLYLEEVDLFSRIAAEVSGYRSIDVNATQALTNPIIELKRVRT